MRAIGENGRKVDFNTLLKVANLLGVGLRARAARADDRVAHAEVVHEGTVRGGVGAEATPLALALPFTLGEIRMRIDPLRSTWKYTMGCESHSGNQLM
jgi:hypothetical protein